MWRIVSGSHYVTTDENGNIRLKIYTDTAHFYSLEYPMTFIVEQDPGSKDWGKSSRPVTFRAPNYPREHIMSVQADSTPALAQSVTADWSRQYRKPVDITINGRKAEYVHIEFKSSVESYVDHNYLITNTAGGSVFIQFRERYQHNESLWDGGGNVPTFEKMVQSIRLL